MSDLSSDDNAEPSQPLVLPMKRKRSPTSDSDSDTDSAGHGPSRGGRGSGSGCGRGRGSSRGGCGRGSSRGGRGRGSSRGGRGRGSSRGGRSRCGGGDQEPEHGSLRGDSSYVEFILPNARTISEKDKGFIEPPKFEPTRPPGPHLPAGETSALEMYFDDSALDMILESTLSYAEENKERKKGRYVCTACLCGSNLLVVY